MLKTLVKKILQLLGVLPESAVSSWQLYKDYIKVHPTAIIAPSATVKIFNLPVPPRICLEIGEGSHIFSNFALLRPEATIRVGKRTQLGNSSFICADSIEVGDDILMAWDCTIMDNDSHALEWEFRKNDVTQCYRDYQKDSANLIKNKDWTRVKMAPIVLGDKSWIGFSAAILKGVVIGEGAVVGAGSVVSRSVPPFCVAAGNPAKIIKELQESSNQ